MDGEQSLREKLGHRLRVAAGQGWLCFYCRASMWSIESEAFAKQFGITVDQAKRFRCTSEHMNPRHDGGTDDPWNIVAACLFCNNGRHQRRPPPSPMEFRHIVATQIQDGGWHPAWAFRAEIVTRDANRGIGRAR